MSTYCKRTGKVKYLTGGEAQRVVDAMRRKPNRGRKGGRLNVYRCTACSAWHVGNREKDNGK